jgi:hypothetical protein
MADELPMIQAEYRDFVENAVVPGLYAVAEAVRKKAPNRQANVEYEPLENELLGRATLTIRDPDNPDDVFIFVVVAVKYGSGLARAEYQLGPAVVDGRLQTSTRDAFGPDELGRDAHPYMIRPTEVQTYVQRRYDEVREARAARGI